jgi:hypothetical protein
MDYDFSRLTLAQEWLICLHGWHIDKTWPDGRIYVQPSKRTVRKLIERGLLVPREVRRGMLTVTEYSVPLDVHLAYCMQYEAA